MSKAISDIVEELHGNTTIFLINCRDEDAVFLHPEIAEAYHNALALISNVNGKKFIIAALNEQFEKCNPSCAFIYDYMRECIQREFVMTYYEYKLFAARFPRVRV